MAGHITIMTFGYSYGGPGSGFKHVANVQNVRAARSGTPENDGRSGKVHDEVMANSAAKAWLEKMKKWSLEDGDKVAIGCSRGHHRSVAIAVEYASWLRSQGYSVTLQNRDISKAYALTFVDLLREIQKK